MRGWTVALAETLTVATEGITSRAVSVQANVGAGLPGIHITGLPDTAVSQAADRVKMAIVNSGLPWPKVKTVLNLAPANVRKKGSHFDLAMALAVLLAQNPTAESLFTAKNVVVMGELGLDGTIKPVERILPTLRWLAEAGVEPLPDTIIIPAANKAIACELPGVQILLASTLSEVWAFFTATGTLPPLAPGATTYHPVNQPGDFRDIAGQREAKFAAEISAAGGHHMVLLGPPGSGKSMIAAAMAGILPALTEAQQLETTCIYEAAGMNLSGMIGQPPFVEMHHSVTIPGLIGGGSGSPKPGAVSLAHNGVLFLDEVSEVAAKVLDSLRIPLEEGMVALKRSDSKVCYPAEFQLVMAANLCHCGAEDPEQCTCKPLQRRNYLNNISGPLRDRLDLAVTTHAKGALLYDDVAETTATIAERVDAARQRAAARWAKAGKNYSLNGRVEPQWLRRHYPAQDDAMSLLSAYLADGTLSQRGVDRSLKVAWTLADLTGDSQPNLDHVATAVDLRQFALPQGVTV